MNKYLRNVTASRLFERICFRDGPESPGDEILHSIRRFKAAPEFRRHTRTVSLYLNRPQYPGPDYRTHTQPYHYLVLPELVDALFQMPAATELYIRLGGVQGARCLDGLRSAVNWGSAGRTLNIRSFTVSPDHLEDRLFLHGQQNFQYEFLDIFPQLETFCYEGCNLSR